MKFILSLTEVIRQKASIKKITKKMPLLSGLVLFSLPAMRDGRFLVRPGVIFYYLTFCWLVCYAILPSWSWVLTFWFPYRYAAWYSSMYAWYPLYTSVLEHRSSFSPFFLFFFSYFKVLYLFPMRYIFKHYLSSTHP